jgi:Zn-dependent M16 (insulinase) family peptidase
MAAVMILMEYLTDTAVAPLQRDFVELTEPYCSEVFFS